MLTCIREQDRRSSEAFVEHFHTKYTFGDRPASLDGV